MELYILYGELAKRLEAQGISVVFNKVGNLFTSLEMMGVTLTVMKVDDELESCLEAPCNSVGITVAGDMAAGRTYTGSVAGTVLAAAAPTTAKAAAAPRTLSGATVALATAGDVVRDLITTINSNRAYLSEIDGLIGDGDHGINMSKGFTGCGTRLDALGAGANDLPKAFEQLSQALMDDIGGSMGPLYGNFFLGFVKTLEPHAAMDAALFGDALAAAVANVQSMGNAKVGDKTLIDTMVPALNAYRDAVAKGASFADALQAMSVAAEAGKDSTKDLQARIGRSARLGPRSIGVLDAGATSCCLILQSISTALQQRLAQ
jgi:dihydroxyacetone kinase